MTYLPYIVAAYAVFALVLAWDAMSPWLRQRRVLRAIRLRTLRTASLAKAPANDPIDSPARDSFSTDEASNP